MARFNAVLGEYRKAPDVVRTRLYYEMYDNVFANAGSTDLIDKTLRNFIPLKNVSGGSPAAQPAGLPISQGTVQQGGQQ